LKVVSIGDIVQADVVTERPLARALWPIDWHVPDCNFLEPEVRCRARLQDQIETERAHHVDTARQMLQQQSAGSAVIDMLVVAANRLASPACHAKKERRLIIFSDMIEESDRYEFKEEDFTDQRIAAMLAEIDRSLGLPDFSGVQVWVIGASAVADTVNVANGLPLGNEAIIGIRKFWGRFFDVTGAAIPENRWCPRLCDWS
jgi:predicted nucleic acid-binding protein